MLNLAGTGSKATYQYYWVEIPSNQSAGMTITFGVDNGANGSSWVLGGPRNRKIDHIWRFPEIGVLQP